MRKINLSIFLLMVVFLTLLFSGCNGLVPDKIPNEEYSQENTDLVDLKILPAKIDIKINQPSKFELKAYNSDGNLIIMDLLKFEEWVVRYQCGKCGTVWSISPRRGSFVTTFTPFKAGRYTLSAKYDGKWAQAVVYAK